MLDLYDQEDDAVEAGWRWRWEELGERVYFEIKPEVPSVGELVRQINRYRHYRPGGTWVVVTPDDRYAGVLATQGIKLVVPNQTGPRPQEVAGAQQLKLGSRPAELDGRQPAPGGSMSNVDDVEVLGEGSHKALAQEPLSTVPEQAVEMAYRRGFQQGFDVALQALERGATTDALQELGMRIAEWRHQGHTGRYKRVRIPPK